MEDHPDNPDDQPDVWPNLERRLLLVPVGVCIMIGGIILATVPEAMQQAVSQKETVDASNTLTLATGIPAFAGGALVTRFLHRRFAE